MSIPFLLEMPEDDLDDSHEKGGSAGGGVEDSDEEVLWLYAGGDLQVLVTLRHLTPGSGRGEAIFEAKVGLKEFVDAADDVGDDRLGRVEDTALNFFLRVVGLQKMLVEVDNGVLVAAAVAEVSLHCLGVGMIEESNDVLNAQFVEVEGPFTACHAQKHAQQLTEERVSRRDHVYEVLYRNPSRLRKPGCE